MLLCELPVFVPKTVDDLGRQGSDESAVAQLERDLEAKRASIRSWMSKTPVIGIPLDSNIADPVNGEEEDDNQSQEEDEGPMGSAGGSYSESLEDYEGEA